ncbi:MAG: translesion error-prone DNA polymerase V autoproteolytic subunit [Proteobacteria bacterium]|nr:MAG: translesion error-prone DNA polymerase V autoproteolytic subunit [Pseudomonadota bacterium]
MQKLMHVDLSRPNSEGIKLAIETVSCGFPSPAVDYFSGETLNLHDLLIQRPTATFFARAEGDSMFPLIRTGDLLIIDRSVTVKNNSVVLAEVDGGHVVKHYRVLEHGIFLCPENADYEPTRVTQDVVICGVVTSVVHSFR